MVRLPPHRLLLAHPAAVYFGSRLLLAANNNRAQHFAEKMIGRSGVSAKLNVFIDRRVTGEGPEPARPKNQKPPFKDPETPAAVGLFQTISVSAEVSNKRSSDLVVLQWKARAM
jgi:hypothetical protein